MPAPPCEPAPADHAPPEAPAPGLTTSALVALYFGDLRALAAARMRGERPGHTLQPTALANEAFLRLSPASGASGGAGGEAAGDWGGEPAGGWRDKAHFLVAASVAIQRILVDHARGRACAKRGGAKKARKNDDSGPEIQDPGPETQDSGFDSAWRRVSLDEASVAAAIGLPGCDLLDLGQALRELDAVHPRAGTVVRMRFYGGVSEPGIGRALGISERTVRNDWELARKWLHRRLRTGDDG